MLFRSRQHLREPFLQGIAEIAKKELQRVSIEHSEGTFYKEIAEVGISANS